MLKKEAIKQAIDAIAERQPAIGYSLQELFGTGRIDVAADVDQNSSNGSYHFIFDQRMVPVRKINLFLEGSAAIEQKLLIQYGEMAQRRSLAASGRAADYTQAETAIRTAGLGQLARYEIQRAYELSADGAAGPLETLSGRKSEPKADARRLLESLLQARPSLKLPESADDQQILFCGAVDADTPAFFMPFPYTMQALIQVADMDLSYFSPRFILNCLLNATAANLFACLVNGQIAGLIYLRRRQTLRSNALEIRYVSSARDARSEWLQRHPLHRGVGTFLIAGAWLLWKNTMPQVREMVLDAERPTLDFYQELGFRQRRPYVYVLKRPAGYLLNALVVMVDRSPGIRDRVVEELLKFIQNQVNFLARHPRQNAQRDNALAFIKLCLLSRSRPRPAKSAAALLLRLKSSIPETESLLELAVDHGRIQVVEEKRPIAHPLLVFKDDHMLSHLQGILHLENANRLKAIDSVLRDATLKDKWTPVDGRAASIGELAWVHTAEHIARIAATAEKSMVSLDLDTQTTKDSYSAARLAVGGIFSLLDGIFSTPAHRGFAAVRPPGHHATPDKAMGFCLFNNIALGACYAKRTWGLKKVMIVDIDAHHGNGTQAAFFNTDEVLFISMHQFPAYPGSGNYAEIGQDAGKGHSVNVPLRKGMGDREFVQVLDRLVRPLTLAYEPGIILVSCGFDLYQHDRLAELNGTPEGYAMMTRQLCRLADTVCDGRIAFIMEGGYSIQGIRDCGLRIIRELCRIPTFETIGLDKLINGSASSFLALNNAIAIHKAYWPVLTR